MAELEGLERYWRRLLLLFWLIFAILALYAYWNAIGRFALGDTDDNMRMMQVRGLLSGQGWYDLRQYRLDPPGGADIHWSRLVDLPIAAIKLALMPLLGGAAAERAAVAVAPLLPLGVVMTSVAVIARRMISPKAFAIAIAILFCAPSTRTMFMPLRIDHQSRRLASYGASLAGGCSAAYLVFASYANRAPVCDALSPVWLSVVVSAGALAFILAYYSPRDWRLRLGAAAAAGILLAAAFAYFWPHCLGRLEGVSPLAERLWLHNVREAMPLYRHGFSTTVTIASLPVIGLVGYAVMLWRSRSDQPRFFGWLMVAIPALLGAGLLLWQSRAGPAAQLLAVPGATALGWLIIPRIFAHRLMLVRVFGVVLAFLLVSGILSQQALRLIPDKPNPRLKAVGKANASCPTLAALKPIALQPKGYVLTFVDLGPRLITVTHHDAVAGPYHRNDEDIADVSLTFRGSAEHAKAVIDRRGIDYVLICPGLSESTIYASQAKDGFYMQLVRGRVPTWLTPIGLPRKSPYRMWRVIKPAAPAPQAP